MTSAQKNRASAHRTKHFPFFRLPAELRDEIYDLSLLKYEITRAHDSRRNYLALGIIVENAPPANLLLVCQQFKRELLARIESHRTLPSITMYDSPAPHLPSMRMPPPALRKCASFTINSISTQCGYAIPLDSAPPNTLAHPHARIEARSMESSFREVMPVMEVGKLTINISSWRKRSDRVHVIDPWERDTDIWRYHFASFLGLDFYARYKKTVVHLCERWEWKQVPEGTCADPGVARRKWEFGDVYWQFKQVP